jgi:hypothetical protein
VALDLDHCLGYEVGRDDEQGRLRRDRLACLPGARVLLIFYNDGQEVRYVMVLPVPTSLRERDLEAGEFGA